jgi:hypothetical protein
MAGFVLILSGAYLFSGGISSKASEESFSYASLSNPKCFKPVNGSISYLPGGVFAGSFTNVFGLPVKVAWMDLSEGSDNNACQVEYSKNSVAPGNDISVSGVCPSKKPGTRYLLTLKTGYTNPESSAERNETMVIEGWVKSR